jgi:hypothetical protein
MRSLANAQVPVELTPVEADVIAHKIIDEKVCQAKLKNTQDAYMVCTGKPHEATPWFQRPEVVVPSIVGAGLLGLLTGLTRCFGACR